MWKLQRSCICIVHFTWSLCFRCVYLIATQMVSLALHSYWRWYLLFLGIIWTMAALNIRWNKPRRFLNKGHCTNCWMVCQALLADERSLDQFLLFLLGSQLLPLLVQLLEKSFAISKWGTFLNTIIAHRLRSIYFVGGCFGVITFQLPVGPQSSAPPNKNTTPKYNQINMLTKSKYPSFWYQHPVT